MSHPTSGHGRPLLPRLRLLAPAEIASGTPVPLTLLVENVSALPLDLHLQGRPIAFDVVVVHADSGAVVWRRLQGAVVSAVLQIWTLQPGELLRLDAEWSQHDQRGAPVSPGLYRLWGALRTDEPTPLESDRVELRVLPA